MNKKGTLPKGLENYYKNKYINEYKMRIQEIKRTAPSVYRRFIKSIEGMSLEEMKKRVNYIRKVSRYGRDYSVRSYKSNITNLIMKVVDSGVVSKEYKNLAYKIRFLKVSDFDKLYNLMKENKVLGALNLDAFYVSQKEGEISTELEGNLDIIYQYLNALKGM